MERAERLDSWAACPRPLVAPSLLACDFARMVDEFDALDRAGARVVHLDVMDGHFVPNLSYGAPVIHSWRKVTDVPFDAHLMMAEPGRYLDDFLAAGCDQITVHIEVLPDPSPVLRAIRNAGCRASLALNPPTPVESLFPHLDKIDSVLVMSVMPGFGGQAFDAKILPKIATLRARAPRLEIGVDGGIKPDTAAAAVQAGATQLIAGSAVFLSDGSYAEALAELAEGARRGLLLRGGTPASTAGPPSPS